MVTTTTNNNRVNLEQVSSLNIEQSRLLQYEKNDKHAKCVQNANIHDMQFFQHSQNFQMMQNSAINEKIS